VILRLLESFLARLYAWVDQVKVWDDHEDPVAVQFGSRGAPWNMTFPWVALRRHRRVWPAGASDARTHTRALCSS